MIQASMKSRRLQLTESMSTKDISPSKASTDENSNSPSKVSQREEDGIPHVVRITILGLCGVSVCKDWENTWRDKHRKSLSDIGMNISPRKMNALKVPKVPEPSDIGIFVSLSSQSNIGTKYLPPLQLTHAVPDQVQGNTDDVEVDIYKNDTHVHHHVYWPEEEATKRENKFVFDTIFQKSPPSPARAESTLDYIPKSFSLEIGLYSRQRDETSSKQGFDDRYGVVLGNTSLELSAAESLPPSLSPAVNLSTTIFSRMLYLPISNVERLPQVSGKQKDLKTDESVRILKSKLDPTTQSVNGKSRRKKKKIPAPSMSDVDAIQSKYSFQSGLGYLVVAVEVYPKGSDEERRIDFIRKQIKKQAMMSSADGSYKMIRYLSPKENWFENIPSNAHCLFAESFRMKSSTGHSVMQQCSSDSDPILIGSMSSLMDESEEDDDDDDDSSHDDYDDDDSDDDDEESTEEENEKPPAVTAKRDGYNILTSLVSRLGSCSVRPTKEPTTGSEKVLSNSESHNPELFSSLKGVTDYLGCQTRVDPDLTRVEEETFNKKVVMKPPRYDDDQTIFSGIPYFTDQRLE